MSSTLIRDTSFHIFPPVAIYATMPAMLRYDRAPIKATKTPEGFVIDSPVLSRVGVFPYRQPNGAIQYEFRPPEEVFHPEHLASIAGKPITEEHHGALDGTNTKGKLIGSTTSPGRQDAENPHHLVGDIVIHDVSALTSKKDLSLGYRLDLEMTPGEFEGVRYDAIQRNLRVNHVAVTLKGRAGTARLNLDAADAVSVSTEEEIMTLVKVRLDSGQEHDAAPEVAVAIALSVAKLQAEKNRADAAEGARDALQAQVDGHAAALTQARQDALVQVQARAKLEADAARLNVKFAQDADDTAVRVAVIKSVRGDSFDPTGKSDAYLQAAYDMAIEQAATAKANAAANRATIAGVRGDSADKPPVTAASARQAMIAEMKKSTTGA
jgi:hypothetical protein